MGRLKTQKAGYYTVQNYAGDDDDGRPFVLSRGMFTLPSGGGVFI